MEMKQHVYRSRVRYSETDSMGFVHNSKYLVFFEEARTDLVRTIGYSYARIESEGMIFPVSEAKIDYKRPVGYDEPFRIVVTLGYLRHVSAKFKYSMLLDDDTLVCSGYTIHAALDRSTLEFAEVPEELRELLQLYVEPRTQKKSRNRRST